MENTDCCNEVAGSCNGTVVDESKVYSTFDYVGSLTSDQQSHCESVRAACRDLATLIRANPAYKTRTFSDRCISESITCLESCCQYAIKAVCFQGKTVV